MTTTDALTLDELCNTADKLRYRYGVTVITERGRIWFRPIPRVGNKAHTGLETLGETAALVKYLARHEVEPLAVLESDDGKASMVMVETAHLNRVPLPALHEELARLERAYEDSARAVTPEEARFLTTDDLKQVRQRRRRRCGECGKAMKDGSKCMCGQQHEKDESTADLEGVTEELDKKTQLQALRMLMKARRGPKGERVDKILGLKPGERVSRGKLRKMGVKPVQFTGDLYVFSTTHPQYGRKYGQVFYIGKDGTYKGMKTSQWEDRHAQVDVLADFVEKKSMPPQMKRCVADLVAKGKSTDAAFAICTSSFQRSGQMKPGEDQRDLTAKGKKRAKELSKKKDHSAKVQRYKTAIGESVELDYLLDYARALGGCS